MKSDNELVAPGWSNLILADDDKDDCMMFTEALEELSISTNLTTVHNGVQLIQLVRANVGRIWDVLFMDLNMPLKSGFTCLKEIRSNDTMNNLPIIIFSTSFDLSVIDMLYKNGADFYIRKPAEFWQLKNVIQQAYILTASKEFVHTTRANFVIGIDSKITRNT